MGKGGYLINSDESFRVAGGNQSIALELARRLGPAVCLATPVHAVRWTDGSTVVVSRQREVEADRVVVAVPARLTDSITFDPPLPDWKRAALQRVDYGHAAKLFVPLRQTAPPSAVMAVPDRFWSWTANGADGTVQPIVSCFAGSAAALTALRVADGPERWLERLAWLRPDLALDTDGAVLATWDDDPWIGAAYSSNLAGRPRRTAELIQPVGPLHFAGEHTAEGFSATMEGALRSGRRAAKEIENPQ
jgi:monoamine oxidase